MNSRTKAPKHLRKETKVFWSSVVRDFQMEHHHIHVLTAACEAWDRVTQSREAITKAGAFFTNRHGEIKPHPGLAVERDNRALFARLIRELNLDVDSPAEPYSRPPRLGGGS
jgi:P27 family predicted phage terminase small subunit